MIYLIGMCNGSIGVFKGQIESVDPIEWEKACLGTECPNLNAIDFFGFVCTNRGIL